MGNDTETAKASVEDLSESPWAAAGSKLRELVAQTLLSVLFVRQRTPEELA